VKGVERPELQWLKAGRPFEHSVIEGKQRDHRQRAVGADKREGAVARSGASSLDEKQCAADDRIARGDLLAQRHALGF
jgi:hypothetical protein